MYIITEDGILADALEVMLKELGFAGVIKRTTVPRSSDLMIIDCDTVEASAENAIRISSDRKKGADLIKPFRESDFKKLLALYAPGAPEAAAEPNACVSISDGGLVYRGSFVSLSPAEQRIASLLADNYGNCVSSEALIRAIGADSDLNSLRVYVGMLRKKLDFAFGERLIYTVRNKGYLIK